MINSFMKTCSKCGIEKPLTEFNSSKNKVSGKYYYSSYCKPCYNKKSTEYHYANWGKHLEHARKAYHNRKDKFWSVYLIPSINYVGKTNFPEDRMATHRSESNIDTTGWSILHTNLTESEALEIEKSYHNRGYTGFKNWNKK